METIDNIRKLALSLPEAIEMPHFEKTSFRVKKKIFATYDATKNTLVLKFNAIDQSVFVDGSKAAIYPSKGAWGKQGWTVVELKNIHPDLCKDALITSYCTVAPAKLAAPYLPK